MVRDNMAKVFILFAHMLFFFIYIIKIGEDYKCHALNSDIINFGWLNEERWLNKWLTLYNLSEWAILPFQIKISK